MNNLQQYGSSLIGKTAQSKLLTVIDDNGRKVLEQPQLITDFEIVSEFGEHSLMVTIGGVSVYEDTLININ